MQGTIKSVEELVQRVAAVAEAKRDYVADTRSLHMQDNGQLLDVAEAEGFKLQPIAHSQIAQRLRIPADYYERAGTIPGLRAYNVNEWLHNNPERRMVRTLSLPGEQPIARAFLSDRFRPFDHADMMGGILPVLAEHHGLEVLGAEITERRLYFRLAFPKLTMEYKRGEAVRAGVIFSNSEVGAGAWDVRAFLLVLICTNGMTAESLVRKYHVGRRLGGDDSEEASIFRSDTVAAEVQAVRLQLRDVLGAALSEAAFTRRVEQITAATADKLDDPIKAVEDVTKRYNLTGPEAEAVTKELIKSGEPSRWGIAQSLTAYARQLDNPDRAYDLQRAGWAVASGANTREAQQLLSA